MVPNEEGDGLRNRFAAWLPILQGYGSFTVGLGGVIAQLVVFATTPTHVLNLFALGLCGLLCGRPEQFVPFVMQYVGIKRKE